MVGIELIIKIGPQKQTEFYQAYEMNKTNEKNNVSRAAFELFKKVDDPDVFLWREHWANQESLKHYLRGSNFRASLGAF